MYQNMKVFSVKAGLFIGVKSLMGLHTLQATSLSTGAVTILLSTERSCYSSELLYSAVMLVDYSHVTHWTLNWNYYCNYQSKRVQSLSNCAVLIKAHAVNLFHTRARTESAQSAQAPNIRGACARCLCLLPQLARCLTCLWPWHLDELSFATKFTDCPSQRERERETRLLTFKIQKYLQNYLYVE